MIIEIWNHHFNIADIKDIQEVGGDRLRIYFFKDTDPVDIHLGKEERLAVIQKWEELALAYDLKIVDRIVKATTEA